MTIFYKKSLLEKNGVAAPKTFEDLDQVCQALKSKGSYHGAHQRMVNARRNERRASIYGSGRSIGSQTLNQWTR
jgi:ABC-type glycerol-3-phosphate transport system substrate-binding protein